MIHTNLRVVWITELYLQCWKPFRTGYRFSLDYTCREFFQSHQHAHAFDCSLYNSLREQTPIDQSNLFQLHWTTGCKSQGTNWLWDNSSSLFRDSLSQGMPVVGGGRLLLSFIHTWGNKVLHKPNLFHHITYCGRDKLSTGIEGWYYFLNQIRLIFPIMTTIRSATLHCNILMQYGQK